MEREAHHQRGHDHEAHGKRGYGRPVAQQRLLVGVAGLLEEKGRDEEHEEELRVSKHLRGVLGHEGPYHRAQRDLRQRQRDAGEDLAKDAGRQHAAKQQEDDLKGSHALLAL